MPAANGAACARVFSVLLLVAVPRVALAADPPRNDPAGAHVLFYEARALMQQSKFAEACPKLEESMRLDPGVGTQFNLADCNEHLGKVTAAWAGFLEVAAASKAANQPERETHARKRALALEARLPKLVVDVTDAPVGLEVRRDGIAVGRPAWGTPIPVDPGTHRISATAPGMGTWETTIAATEGKTARVSIPRDLPPADAGAIATTTTTTAATDFPPPIVEQYWSTERTVGWIVAGAGVVGLGLGVGFGLSSLGQRDESRSHCVADQCDPDGVRLRDDAMLNGNIATVATIAGGAALAGGLVLVLVSSKSTESPVRAGQVRAVPNVAVNGGGFTLQGSFP